MVSIEIPDDIGRCLQENWEDVPRRVLESVALEGYRSRALGEGLVRRLLGFETRFEVHAFLKAHDVPLNYSLKDLEQDRQTHDRLGI